MQIYSLTRNKFAKRIDILNSMSIPIKEMSKTLRGRVNSLRQHEKCIKIVILRLYMKAHGCMLFSISNITF